MERNLNEHEKLLIKELIEAFTQNTPQKLLYIHSNPIKKKKVVELLKQSHKSILSNNIQQPK